MTPEVSPTRVSTSSSVPSEAVIAYARRLIRRQGRYSLEDVDDIIGQALLDFVRADRCGRPCSDGLFLVIVRRRSCDFWRSRRASPPIEAAPEVACWPNDDHLMERTLQESLLRVSAIRHRVDRRRLLGITRHVFSGATFAEACRAIGIPRGSQGRYRQYLRELVTGLDASRPR